MLQDEALENPDFLRNATVRLLRYQAAQGADHARLSEQVEGLPEQVWQVAALPLAESYLTEQVEPLAISDPARQVDRALMEDFLASPDSGWWWWTAQPWAGKTSFMADLAVRPPAGVFVAAFLTMGRDTTANDRRDFFDSIMPQIAVWAGRSMVHRAGAHSPSERLREFQDLLSEAGDNCRRKGQSLLLLVDGLDEDKGTEGSIAAALPPTLPVGVKVVVASRTMPRLDVPYDHPLATPLHSRELKASPGAVARQEQAFRELDNLWLVGPPDRLGRTLACLVAAAEAPLTAIDLAELASRATNDLIEVPTVEDILGDHAARVFHRVTLPGGDGFRLGHDTLDDRVIEILDPRNPRAHVGGGWAHHRQEVLAPWRAYLHEWVDTFAAQGWARTTTPGFAGEPYFALLSKTGNLPRMTALATDLARHRYLFHVTGSNYAAYREAHVAAQGHTHQVEPHLPTLTILSVYLDAMSAQHNRFPIEIFRAWAVTKQTDHALDVAATITDPDRQAEALAALVEALAPTDPDRAAKVAATITSPYRQAEALTALAKALAPTDPDRARGLVQRAEEVAATITDPYRQAQALTALAKALAPTDPDRARGLVQRVEEVAATITSTYRQAEALAALVEALAPTDPDRAEEVAATITDPYRQAEALTALVEALAPTDPDRAEEVAATITSPYRQAGALTALVEALAPTDPDRAEEVAATITDPYRQAGALTALAKALAPTDPDRAEEVTATITDSYGQAGALAALAKALAPTDPDRARGLVQRVEEVAGTITDSYEQAGALTALVEALAPTDPDRAEEVAATITDPDRQAGALTALVEALAPTDPDRAEKVAATITDPYRQAEALAALAKALAPTDPDRAEEVAATITDSYGQAGALAALAKALAPTDPDRARGLVQRAEEVAATSTDPYRQAGALTALAKALAPTDPDRARGLVQRAEEVAATSTDSYRQAGALTALAKALAPTDPDRARGLVQRAEAVAATSTDPYRQAGR
ncbi:hypothetical protein BW730_14220 [Tessaracoccus aquimaris]|uniref:Uncharacterized protein n=1 Tax=Tessaracoccus aquimaris TaxID=1332264 RepID=A0A1Q2CQV8_9ACTN|nr:hypothetical protein BW730_14220 [Tessaracoccus aquimaris]